MGPAFVVGSAPCLYDDVGRAHKIFPLAVLMLVNGACTAFENAEHMLCGHEEKSAFFVRERRIRFPNAPPIQVHACCNPKRQAQYTSMFPDVTRWWPNEVGAGATSASKSAKILMLMGYAPIVLCGCPLDQEGYFEGEAQVPQHIACQRIGDHGIAHGLGIPVQETRIVKAYRARFKELAQGEFKNRVFSMSGFTRDQLGLPPKDL